MLFKHDVTERSDVNPIMLTYDANTKTLGAIFQDCFLFL